MDEEENEKFKQVVNQVRPGSTTPESIEAMRTIARDETMRKILTSAIKNGWKERPVYLRLSNPTEVQIDAAIKYVHTFGTKE